MQRVGGMRCLILIGRDAKPLVSGCHYFFVYLGLLLLLSMSQVFVDI